MTSTTLEAPPSPTKNEPAAPLRLEFLDGLRGLSALYVAFYHDACDRGALSPLAIHATNWTRYGHFAVGIFIVLSGYCLMLPVARTPDGALRGGVGAFFKRRARRLLPPYYAALLITLALIAISAKLKHQAPLSASDGEPVFAAWNIVTHLLLVHNVTRYVGSINGALWSVATEWQIYFVFALALLPLSRRFGMAAALAIGLLLGVAPHFLAPAGYDAPAAYPWMIGLFAMGMAGAAISFSRTDPLRRAMDRIPWCIAAVLASAAVWTELTLRPSWRGRFEWQTDVMVGLAATCLILACVRTLRAGRSSLALRLLESRAAVKLGAFSYSLYLMHLPARWTLQPILRFLPIKPALVFPVEVLVTMPFALLVSYLFYTVFERPFVNTPATTPTTRSHGATA